MTTVYKTKDDYKLFYVHNLIQFFVPMYGSITINKNSFYIDGMNIILN